MKGRPIDQLVFEQVFPKPRSQDPQSFHALLQRHLILEVRQEVHSFYGHLDTPEAKYPGLDYTNHTHRTRLSRWQWHRRLFRAFDALRLTPNEISGLTKWEGTKWAKERYERENNCVIRDTAADGMRIWDPTDLTIEREVQANPEPQTDVDEAMDKVDEDDSEGELESVGVSLNERLRERLAARAAGDSSLPLDEAWEQWFKNAVETGEITSVRDSVRDSVRERQRMINNARAGHWDEIPEVLQDMVRDALQAEESRALRGRNPVFVTATASSLSTPLASSQVGILSAPLSAIPHTTHTSAPRSSHSGLRIPGAFQRVDDGATSHAQRTNS